MHEFHLIRIICFFFNFFFVSNSKYRCSLFDELSTISPSFKTCVLSNEEGIQHIYYRNIFFRTRIFMKYLVNFLFEYENMCISICYSTEFMEWHFGLFYLELSKRLDGYFSYFFIHQFCYSMVQISKIEFLFLLQIRNKRHNCLID